MLAVQLALACFTNALPTCGEPFADLGFEPALEKAQKEKKLLLLDFTASWCGPCHKMEKDTWAAADVRAWLSENAIAVQVDVDEERELAQRFRIEAMPTVVVLREGGEFDRVVGYKNAAQFLDWGRAVRAGKRSSDALLERSKALLESSDTQARYDVAKDLLRANLYEESLLHFLWLWPATRGASGFGGVRTSFMLSSMATLAKKHEPAKKAFDAIFAELQAKVDRAETPTYDDWKEWTAFCERFGGRARIVAWYEKHRDEQGGLLVDQTGFLAEHIVDEVFEVLMDEDRVQDAARVGGNPMRRAERLVESFRVMRTSAESMDEEQRKGLEDHARRKLIDDMSKLYAATLLVEHREEAAAVAARLIETLDTPEARLGLVRHGLDLARKPDPSFTRWLDEAEATGGNVRILRKRLSRLERGEGDEKGD